MIFIRFAIIAVLLILLFSNNLIFVKNLFSPSLNAKNEIERLALENDSLKTELYIAENLSGKELSDGKWEYFYSKIFSSYPFNDQNLIGIASGEISGIQQYQAVAAAPGVLLGQIIKVNKNTALVRTIFDKDFIAAVKIGENKTDALLKGGIPPTLEMIEKSKTIKNGEVVYNADKNYPYGFKLGEVQIVENKNTDTAGLFQKAYLRVDYSIALLEDALIIKNFEVLKN
ncbi:MAG: rod shape-determining protein MreC [bacterium]|nr:rod shape-determining protein MreC [bacterium]